MGRKPSPIPARIAEPPKPQHTRRDRWRRVDSARLYIQGQSKNIAKALVKKAVEGDAQSARWLLAHTAATDDTGAEARPVSGGVDRPTQQTPSPVDAAPRIQIGVLLGQDFARLNTTPEPLALPAQTPQSVSPIATPSQNSNDLGIDRVLASQADTVVDAETVDSEE